MQSTDISEKLSAKIPKSLEAIQKALAENTITCEQLVCDYLQQIKVTKHLNAYVEVFADEALTRAKNLDARYAKDPETCGKLFGAVVSIKDVICYEGHQVTAASKILEGFTSIFSATAVERLLAEDAIIIGRTNCDQFAMGSDNTNSVYGPVHNAADDTRVAGGSSGGAAVSVQANTCLIALGSDTGGSVRQPAAFCDVFGLKPTYGRISRYGLLAYGSSFDQIGIFAHNIADISLMLDIIAGADAFDATSGEQICDTFSGLKIAGKKNYKIAYLKSSVESPAIEPAIRGKMSDTIAHLEKAGHSTAGIEFDLLDYIIPAYYVLTTAEASSNLSRYDGVRYGFRAENTKSLDEMYKKTRTEGFSEEVKRRIMLGTFVLSAGYYDAYYTKAQKVRRLLTDKINEIFAQYDFILMPASPVAPWKIGEKNDDPVAMYLLDIFTVLANMVGIPGIAVPVGFDENNLPIGLQFLSAKWTEGELLRFVADNFKKRILERK